MRHFSFGAFLFLLCISAFDATRTQTGTPAHNFVIIDNIGLGAVRGTFDGVPEGSVVVGGPRAFRMTYQGGDGNNVVLRERRTR